MSKKDAKYYYDEVQKLLEKYKADGNKVDWWSVCRDLFNTDNPVTSEQDLMDECADYSGRKTENSAWTFSLHIMAWLLYNLKMKTQDGHCQSSNHGHDKTNPKCKKGSDCHNNLYMRCFNSFKDILEEFERNPPKPIGS
jgi:hypothetical protein